MELGSLEYNCRWHCAATATSLTRHRAITPTKQTNKTPCHYAYDPTSLILICPAILITHYTNTPTTQTRLGRALLPRYHGQMEPSSLEYDPVAGIVLLHKPIRHRADMPAEHDPVDKTPCRSAYGTDYALAPYCYRPYDKPQAVLLPKPTSLALYCYPNLIRPRADMPTDPVVGTVLLPESDKIPCRYAYGTCASTVLPLISTCL